MPAQVITIVTAHVDADREKDLQAAYPALADDDLPDGLLSSALLRGRDGAWQITTVWRDREALDTMRARPEPPAAPRVFREVGAEPHLAVFEVVARIDTAL
jgi:hypothetical protein